ncbi:MAG: cation transporter [Planctomycetaceae bacterium]|jgi:cobalt-zinc-cadmium efflux system protein|nr:cation transporter [Planctomycetaceae bacterium]HAA68840.1 cation transporter [Planctomycetaceae bacterium]|tara:strand:+ start:1642 stop:2526 length:885 start_codon:yes stop_codon:yes gene_type:complete
MAHCHHHPAHYDRAFAVGIALNLLLVVGESAAGFLLGSLALLADAGHNLSDVLALGLAWSATLLARRKPTSTRTYGLRRVTILSSCVSAILLLVAMGAIAWEAIDRFADPSPVASGPVMLVAGIGAVINTATALLFSRGHQHDLNIRGAFLHMLADAGISAGVVIGSLILLLTGWLWIDALLSLSIVIIVLVGTWPLLRDSANLAMDAVPRHIDIGAVRTALLARHGVDEIHDLHVWAMSTTDTALTVHLIMPDPPQTDRFLEQTTQALREHFGIHHATIQIERTRCGHDRCEP